MPPAKTAAKSTQKKKNSAFMQPVQLSDALKKVVGPGPMPRTEVIKNVWAYIKKHKLQDQKQKRIIKAKGTDLAAVIGDKDIDMFEMTKKIMAHVK